MGRLSVANPHTTTVLLAHNTMLNFYKNMTSTWIYFFISKKCSFFKKKKKCRLNYKWNIVGILKINFQKIMHLILSWISISVLSFCLNDWLLYAGWNKASKRWQLLQTKNEQKQKFSTFLMNDHLQMNFFLQPKSFKKWFLLMFSR